MIYVLIILGSILIPFYDIIFRVFPFVNVISIDTRIQREIMAVIIALCIGLSAVCLGKLKKFDNKFLLIFLLFQILSIRFMPNIQLVVNGVNSSNFWVWQPVFYGFCFMMMIVSIASHEFTKHEVNNILTAMVYVATLQSLYAMLQFLGFDQFFIVKPYELIHHTKFPNVAGTLGQPTVLSSFVIISIPLAYYLKRYLFLAIMVLAVCVTRSQMAIGAMVISMMIYLTLRDKKFLIPFVFVLIIATALILKFHLVGENGRFTVWNAILAEMRNGNFSDGKIDYSFTGYGSGSYTFMLESLGKGEGFRQVHNEYLELFFNNGWCGVCLFLASLGHMLTRAFACRDKRVVVALFSSFMAIALCAGGCFVWQLGAHIFYTLIIMGMLHNKTILKGGSA